MARAIDENGYRTYFDIPITTEGVYDYAGFQIDQSGKFGLDSKTVYKVYRPRSEVTADSFVKSLEEMPLTDDHTPLGSGEGMLPAERNTHGVLFNVRVNGDGSGLLGDIKVFSESLKRKIDGGKREVSLGYVCSYERASGDFNGDSYDFVQRGLVANHCAIVDEARMGHACRVSDNKAVACDSLELPEMDKEDQKPCADELIEKLKGCSDEELQKVRDALFPPEKKEDEADAKPEDKPAEEDAKDEPPAEDAKPDDDKGKEDEKTAEDAKDIQSACDSAVRAALADYRAAVALAERVKPVFGTIGMDGVATERDLAVKVCAMDSALKSVKSEDAVAALKGYLAGRGNAPAEKVSAGDSAAPKGYDFTAAFKSRK